MVRNGNSLEKKVLLVDDELHDLLIISEQLSPYYTVSVANSVDDALRLADERFYFILTDIVMAKQPKNGIDLIRELRTKELLLPIIAMSGLATPANSAQAIKEGAANFVDKNDLKAPQSLQDLQKTIDFIEREVKEKIRINAEAKRLHMMANFDHKTQMYSHYRFEEDIKNALSLHSRRIYRGQTNLLSILFIDINDMKEANDRLGHEYVDNNLLRTLGTVVRGRLQRSELDKGYRFGGDEFILILPETDAPGAEHVAKMLVQDYDRLKSKMSYGGYLGLFLENNKPTITTEEYAILREKTGSIGIGVAQAPPNEKIIRDQLIQMGDIATYHAKEEGKKVEPHESRIVLYKPGMQYPTGKKIEKR